MKTILQNRKLFGILNLVFIIAISVLNYFYQKNGFDFTLKCITSGCFALLGLINLLYAAASGAGNLRFWISMAVGLILAMMGDVLIGVNFILGAAVFASGHICFVIAFVFHRKFHAADFVISAVLFLAAAAFLLFCPLLTFDVPVFRIVCIVYALIISCMLGKAAGNFLKEKSTLTGIIAAGSLLFFFSDLMLVFAWFIGLWDWTNEACMGTYYPALCLLALSMYLKVAENRKLNKQEL